MVRRGSAKPLFPGSNPGAASKLLPVGAAALQPPSKFGGFVCLEDHAAMPGAIYAFRVVLGETRASGAAGEVTVRTPK